MIPAQAGTSYAIIVKARLAVHRRMLIRTAAFVVAWYVGTVTLVWTGYVYTGLACLVLGAGFISVAIGTLTRSMREITEMQRQDPRSVEEIGL